MIFMAESILTVNKMGDFNRAAPLPLHNQPKPLKCYLKFKD